MEISNNSQKQRNQTLDVLKFFAIFLVLWGHSIQHFLSSNYYDEPLYRIIYSFHMPLFMSLVGFFASSLLDMNVIEMSKKKFRQLLMPALTNGVIFLFLGYYHGGGGTYITCFWFLKSAFICCILFYVSCKYTKSIYIGIVISLIISYFISIFQVRLMYPDFILGYFISKHYITLKRHAGWSTIFSGLVFLIMLIYWDESFWIYGEKPHIWYFSYRLFIGMAGTVFFISLFEYILPQIKLGKIGTYISKWGTYTLGIYILQTFILEIVLAHFIKFDRSNFYIFNFVIAPCISFLVLLICVAIIDIVLRNATLSFLLLGKK